MHLNQEQTFRLEVMCEELDRADERILAAASCDPRKMMATSLANKLDLELKAKWKHCHD